MASDFRKFSRSSLYKKASEIINSYLKNNNEISADEILRFILNNFDGNENLETLKNMYDFSAEIIDGIENLVFENNWDNLNNVIEQYEEYIENVRGQYIENEGNNYLFLNREDLSAFLTLPGKIKDRLKKTDEENCSKNFLKELIRLLANLHNKVIDKFYRPNDLLYRNYYSNHILNKSIQTFLSYAYDDKGLSLGLFIYFNINDGFLFVDWMWNKKIYRGTIIKYELERAIENSDAFLLLRTPKSELRIGRGNHSIRQWCSWEIGAFYIQRCGSGKYYINFYDKKLPPNPILDDFKEMNNVSEGIVY